MLYHAITKDDLKNGIGIRLVLWVSGCEHHCPECHNSFTWDESLGKPFDLWEEADILEYMKRDYVSGITFSGGDPLHPNNRMKIGDLARKVQSLGKNVWLYTGYKLVYKNGSFVFTDDVMHLPEFTIDWFEYIDVIVDGRYDQAVRRQDIYKGADPYWRGSSNQKLINVKESILRSTIVELSDEKEERSV